MNYALVVDGAKQLETRSNLELGLVSLDDGADNRNVDILRTNIVCRGDTCNVDVCNSL